MNAFLNVTDFTYHNGIFSAEISELQSKLHDKRGYPVSVALTNDKTGATMHYDLAKVQRDASGEDIVSLLYLPKSLYNRAGYDVAMNQKQKSTSVVIFND